MLCKILNEEVEPHMTYHDKINMEGNRSKWSEADASSWTGKLEL